MATIRRRADRNNKYQVLVRHRGFPIRTKFFVKLSDANVLHFGMQEYTAYAYRPGFDKVPGYKITFRGNCEKIPKRNIFP